MKAYHGYRLFAPGLGGEPVSGRCCVHVIVEGQPVYQLAARQDIHNHSPDGFEWGYGGSGPAQLALALVADCWGDEWAVPKIYQRVKRGVARLPRDGWTMQNAEVDALIAAAVKETGFVPEVFQ